MGLFPVTRGGERGIEQVLQKSDIPPLATTRCSRKRSIWSGYHQTLVAVRGMKSGAAASLPAAGIPSEEY
jgi:hypothetical protein